jgi:ferredoxin-NADP reductase
VYICGPPAMADATRTSVRRAHVPSRYVHTERFAL